MPLYILCAWDQMIDDLRWCCEVMGQAPDWIRTRWWQNLRIRNGFGRQRLRGHWIFGSLPSSMRSSRRCLNSSLQQYLDCSFYEELETDCALLPSIAKQAELLSDVPLLRFSAWFFLESMDFGLQHIISRRMMEVECDPFRSRLGTLKKSWSPCRNLKEKNYVYNRKSKLRNCKKRFVEQVRFWFTSRSPRYQKSIDWGPKLF